MLIKINKKIFSVFLIIFFLYACGGGENRQVKYLERAKNYFDEENFDKARIEARNVLQINPKNIEARYILGKINIEEGDIRKAYGNFSTVIDEEPENIPANTAMADLFIKVRDYERAIEHCDVILANEPNNAEILSYKSLAYAATERTSEAIELAQKAIDIDAGATEALGVMVQHFFEKKENDKALDLLSKGQISNPDETRIVAMKISLLESMGREDDVEIELKGLANKYPDELSYASTLTRYYVSLTRVDDAENTLRNFIENNEENIDAKLAIISFLLQQRSQDIAIKQTQSYIKDDPDQSDFYLALAELYEFTGEKDQAIDILNKAIDRDPRSVGSIQARNRLVDIYQKDNEKDLGESVLAEILKIEPENIPALLKRAQLSLIDEKVKDGIADLRMVLKNEPDSIIALKLLAGGQEKQGKIDLAFDNMKKVISIEQPPNQQSLANAARLALILEQYQEAENYIRKALELDQKNPDLITNLVRLLALKEDWESAKQFANRLISSDNSKALGHFIQASIDSSLDDFDSAISNLKSSLEAEPRGVESLSALASMLADKRSIDESIKYISSHCEINKNQPHCYHILGSLYARNGDFEKGLDATEKAISLNAKLLIAYRQLAKIYGYMQDFDGVSTSLRRGYEATDDFSLAFDLGTFYYQTKDFEKSAQVYEDLIESSDNALPAKNNLAMIYAEKLVSDENLKKALTLIVDLQESDNPAFLDTVGWVLYLNGDYERAISYIQAAVDKVGSSSTLQYHLGMAFLKNGQFENAKTHLSLSVADKENRFEKYDEAMKILAELN